MADYITDKVMMMKALAFTIETIKADPEPSRQHKELLERSKGILRIMNIDNDAARKALLKEARSNLRRG